MEIFTGIGILIFVFFIYRMIRFYKLHKNIVIFENKEEEYKLDDDNTFESLIGKRVKVENGQLPYSFFLMYKKYTFLGEYVYSEKLSDFSLQGFVLLFEASNSIKKGRFEFEYKVQSPSKEQAKFYFNVRLKKDNPFI